VTRGTEGGSRGVQRYAHFVFLFFKWSLTVYSQPQSLRSHFERQRGFLACLFLPTNSLRRFLVTCTPLPATNPSVARVFEWWGFPRLSCPSSATNPPLSLEMQVERVSSLPACLRLPPIPSVARVFERRGFLVTHMHLACHQPLSVARNTTRIPSFYHQPLPLLKTRVEGSSRQPHAIFLPLLTNPSITCVFERRGFLVTCTPFSFHQSLSIAQNASGGISHHPHTVILPPTLFITRVFK